MPGFTIMTNQPLMISFDCQEEGVLALPFGRDEDFEAEFFITETGINYYGDWLPVNITDLTAELMKQVPHEPLYERMAEAVSIGFIFASYKQPDVMEQVRKYYLEDASAEEIEAWKCCYAVGEKLDHFKPATGSGYALEMEDVIKDDSYRLLMEKYGVDY
jgi:catechol 2,3-dioxygenase-like lactoylglutathione lyase family enzyme